MMPIKLVINMPVVESILLVTTIIGAAGAGITVLINLFQVYMKYRAREDNDNKPNYFTHISSDCCNSANN